MILNLLSAKERMDTRLVIFQLILSLSPDAVALRDRRNRETRSFNSRRSSTDSSEDGVNQNVRDLRQELRDLEEKFRKAMVANASLDNEKCQLIYQVRLRG